ncbi:MAG TPA: UDP-N-acetylmuramate--L-alanine ligase [Candidatus Avacidaminococcus intestinavium]|uniref:UDP-N-acetylmuramate--L-alanine ligase n=1 Tax=Candidatus Avacidaminococcus intestinavium TaxID=2840684 RepID=A0A9D1MN35_9FIRM|nr:UDP-N-acetylmuramate--L-alanine ligase [Candidatus Avacidaminococcus intestinavium]
MLDGIKKIHFIGIGGVGMSAIAYVLLKRGFIVSGSDTANGYIVTKLAKEGAMVYLGHAAFQIEGADAVVISSAIHADNPELKEAQVRKIPVLHRSDVLAELLNNSKGVAIAGAHGKTTTTSMLACICQNCGTDATAIIGGVVNSLGGNAVNGKGELLVAEADESDGSFLKFNPYLAVLTNIENDHLDHYGTEENIYKAFCKFIGNILEGGKAVVCFDNASIRKLATTTNVALSTYAIDYKDADYTAQNIEFEKNHTIYDFYYKDHKLGKVKLLVPGRHNVLNSLGALVAALELGLDLTCAIQALANFQGAKRRFETKGNINGVWIVDDYAHHPTEIKATLAAAKLTKPKRLICIFQPHRYTRTKFLLEEFAQAFTICDKLIITDIYAAGEDPLPGITGQAVCDAIARENEQDVIFIPTAERIVEHLAACVTDGDLVVTIGAGNVYLVGEQLTEMLKRGVANGKE